MSTTDRIRDLVNACLRSPDEEGDYGAIFTLAKMCKDGCSMQVLEMLKRPLKNSSDTDGQIRMVHLLDSLANNANWAFRSNVASEKWMSRLIEVARQTRSPKVQRRICQLLVDWAALYSRDPSLHGFQEFGASRLGHARLPVPSPSISPTIQHQHASPQRGGAPQVVAPLSSSQYSSPPRSGSSYGMQRHQSAPGPVNALQSTFRPNATNAAYGVKTAAPPGFRGAGPMPGRQVSSSGVTHRDPTFRVEDLDMFLCDLDADITALTNGLQRQDLSATELPDLAQQLETNRLKINEYMNRDTDEDTNKRLIEMYQNIEEALECYRAIYAGGQYSDADPDSDREDIYSDEGEGRRGPVDLSNNATAARLGLAPLPQDSTQAELDRLRGELKLRDEKEARLQRELDETKGENEQLKAQASSSAVAVKGAGGQVSPQTLAAIRGFVAKSKVIISTCRDQQLEIVRSVEETQNFMKPGFERCLASMVTLSRRPNNEALIKKLQQDYLKEMKLRKEYFNKIQELRGNIRVFCRVRPLNKKELTQHNAKDVTSYPDADEIVITDENARTKRKQYEFDRVYQPTESQEAVFVDTSPLIESVIDGYNVTIFAYGQTGSGKTYTMEGPNDNPGVYTRALKRLFHLIEEKADTETTTVELSILEIYNEKIKDLLVDMKLASRTSYDVKTGGETGNYISNLSSQNVTGLNDIDRLTSIAHQHRSSGKTNMNEHSSRSHMILYFIVRTENIATGNKSYGKLSLIDLAGSERLKKSQAEGAAATEAAFINKSLSALGDTIASLSSNSKHVPYRNSKLTFLLQDSLSGNSKVLMFANISPADYNTTETMSTLDFAARARNTALGQASKNKG